MTNVSHRSSRTSEFGLRKGFESSSDFVFLVRPCQFPSLDYLMEQIPFSYVFSVYFDEFADNGEFMEGSPSSMGVVSET